MEKEITEALWEQSRRNRRAGNAKMYYLLNRIKAGNGISISEANVSALPYQVTPEILNAFLSFYNRPLLSREQTLLIQQHNQFGFKQYQQQSKSQSQKQSQQKQQPAGHLAVWKNSHPKFKPKTHIANRFMGRNQNPVNSGQEHPATQSHPQTFSQNANQVQNLKVSDVARMSNSNPVNHQRQPVTLMEQQPPEASPSSPPTSVLISQKKKTPSYCYWSTSQHEQCQGLVMQQEQQNLSSQIQQNNQPNLSITPSTPTPAPTTSHQNLFDAAPILTDRIPNGLASKVKATQMDSQAIRNAEELVVRSRKLRLMQSKQLYDFVLGLANNKRPKDERIEYIMTKYDLSTYDVISLFQLYGLQIHPSIIPERQRERDRAGARDKDRDKNSLNKHKIVKEQVHQQSPDPAMGVTFQGHALSEKDLDHPSKRKNDHVTPISIPSQQASKKYKRSQCVNAGDQSFGDGRYKDYDALLVHAASVRTPSDRRLYDAIRAISRGLIPRRNFPLLVNAGLTWVDVNKIRSNFGHNELPAPDDLDLCFPRAGAERQQPQTQTPTMTRGTMVHPASPDPIPAHPQSRPKQEVRSVDIKVLDKPQIRDHLHTPAKGKGEPQQPQTSPTQRQLQLQLQQRRKLQQKEQQQQGQQQQQQQLQKQEPQQLQQGQGGITPHTWEKVKKVRERSSFMRSQGNRQLYDILNKIVRGYKPSARAFLEYKITLDMVNYLRQDNGLDNLTVMEFPYLPGEDEEEQKQKQEQVEEDRKQDQDEEEKELAGEKEDEEDDEDMNQEYSESEIDKENVGDDDANSDYDMDSCRDQPDTELTEIYDEGDDQSDDESDDESDNEDKDEQNVEENEDPGIRSRIPTLLEASEYGIVMKPMNEEETSEPDVQMETFSDEAHDRNQSGSERDEPVELETVTSFRTKQFLYAVESMFLHQKIQEKMQNEENITT